MPRPVGDSSAYRPGLDGIRAIAVVGVILFHAGITWMPGGLMGVGVFFTLSGFLITSILLGSWERRGNLDLAHFWLRRARRLLPALVVMLVVVVAATALTRPEHLHAAIHEAFAGLLYMANWDTITSDQSYFDRFSDPTPFDHLWSLAVEEQFYILWPLILLGLLTLFKGGYRRTAVATGALAAGSFLLLWAIAEPGFDNTRAYEGTDTRAGGLLIGAIVAIAMRARAGGGGTGDGRHLAHQRERAPWPLEVLGVAGLGVIVWLMVTVEEYDLSLYSWGLLALSFATVAVVATASYARSWLGSVLGWEPLRWIGERSYGIYLWHLPVLVALPIELFGGLSWLRLAVVLAITIALAEASWRWLEDPIRRYGFRGAFSRAFARPQTRGISTAHHRSEGDVASAERGRAVVVTGAFGLAIGVLAVALVPHPGRAADLPATETASVISTSTAPTPEPTATPEATPSAEPTTEPSTEPTAEPTTASDGMTSCVSVVHVGDSTSLGLVGEGTPTEDQIPAQYHRVGVENVDTDVLGARSIVERWNGQPNAQEAVQKRVDAGYHGCWVIAMGINEVANQKVGGAYPLPQRIDLIMQKVGDDPVLWPTVKTLKQNGPYADDGMVEMNEALVDACTRYPNLRVYDWRAEVEDSWFGPDRIHYTTEGYTERGARIADALAVAYPSSDTPAASCVVASS
ncbi:acyltransferase family protein [Demequina sp. NBRC 110056]|uniref:acyltransferase family protein n=1 Tax=Demequina sp. NBRC 110056 TaxID=1570345 RepID=UPI0009FC3A45|nr:acyltransferase family protein [Demequina sp. NBRC 110056]